MATYREIQEWVKRQDGFVPKTCWIADIKHRHGLTTRTAPNRHGEIREHPCPTDKRQAIERAFQHFGMMK